MTHVLSHTHMYIGKLKAIKITPYYFCLVTKTFIWLL